MEVKKLKEDKIKQKKKISQLEHIILEMNNVVEVGGYKLLENDEAQKAPDLQIQKKLDKFASKKAQNQVP